MSIVDLYVDTNGANNLVALPDWVSFEYTGVASDVGAGKMDYPASGLNYSLLVDGVEIVIKLDNVEIGRFIYEELDLKKVDETGDNAPASFAGRTTHGYLEEAIWYPPGWPTWLGTTDTVFAAKNPGQIIDWFFITATARGALSQITTSTFNDSVDSSGAAWANNLTITYAAGSNLLDTLKTLVDQGFIEYKLVNKALKVYNFNGVGVDRTIQTDPVILRRGRDLSEAPSKRSTREIRSSILVKGEQNQFVELSDLSSQSQYPWPGGSPRRREMMFSQSGVTDSGTLTVIGQTTIDQVKQAKLEETAGGILGPDSPRPFLDFDVDDWVWFDTDGNMLRYRVKQLTLRGDNTGKLNYSATLNDKFTDWAVRLQRRQAGVLGGIQPISDAGSIAEGAEDAKAPAAPTGLLISSAAYADSRGNPLAQVTASWIQVTTNWDGSPASDIDHYEIAYRFVGDPNWNAAGWSSDTAAYVSSLPIGRSVEFRVRTVDRSLHVSVWAVSSAIVTATDITPPVAPSTPVLASYAPGGFRIYWDGKDAFGAAMVADFDYMEVHASAVNNFTPVALGPNAGGTMIDQVDGGVWLYWANNDYATTYYFKFVAVDKSGNRSTPSTQASGAPSQAKNGDLESLSVGKLTAGSLTADMVIAARIKTADTGQRVEINSTGIKQYNSSGVLRVNIPVSGDAVFQGQIQASSYSTAVTGPRIQSEVSGGSFGQTLWLFYTGVAGETAPGQIGTQLVAGFGSKQITVQPPVFTSPVGGSSCHTTWEDRSATATHDAAIVNWGDHWRFFSFDTNCWLTAMPTFWEIGGGVDDMSGQSGSGGTVLNSGQWFWCKQASGGTTYNDFWGSAYNVGSARRLKDNVQPLTGALAELKKLRAVKFTPVDQQPFGGQSIATRRWKNGPHRSLIAEEVGAVIPEAAPPPPIDTTVVDLEKHLYGGIDIAALLSTTIAAVQELAAIVQGGKP